MGLNLQNHEHTLGTEHIVFPLGEGSSEITRIITWRIETVQSFPLKIALFEVIQPGNVPTKSVHSTPLCHAIDLYR
ncbi:hypothetical protein HUJ05_006352 [Dendroctonus ponderosae]|nr:hypothetical protein HUJ05_006352 [Dendroctonus ponderosae]